MPAVIAESAAFVAALMPIITAIMLNFATSGCLAGAPIGQAAEGGRGLGFHLSSCLCLSVDQDFREELCGFGIAVDSPSRNCLEVYVLS